MNPSLKLGDVTSLNVNVLNGGVQFNVVPSEMCIKADIRVTPTDSHEVCMLVCYTRILNGRVK